MLRRIDLFLQNAAIAAFLHPLIAIVLLLCACAASIAALPNLRQDGRIEAFMHSSDPALTSYYEMRRSFGQDNRIVATIDTPDVFSTDFLKKLSAFHNEITREVPYIAEIFSLYNIPFIQYKDGGVYFEDLVRNILARNQDPHAMRARIMETPLYRNFILSADGKTTSIIIEPYRFAPNPKDCVAKPEQGLSCSGTDASENERKLLGTPQYAEMSAKIRAIAARHQNKDDFDIHIAGAPVVSTEIVRLMSHDMPLFTLLSFAVAVVVIMIIYRNILVAAAALIAFVTSIAISFAIMVLADEPVTPPTQLLIPLLLVTSLCTFIHIISALIHNYDEIRDRRSAVQRALQHVHIPVLFAALTTAFGLISLAKSDLAPITVLGLIGAAGTMISYAISILSAVIVFRFVSERFVVKRSQQYPILTNIMTSAALFCARHSRAVLVFTLVVTTIALIGTYNLQYSHNSLLWLPNDNPARQSTEHIDGIFNGTVNLEVVITPKNGRDFRDETLLKSIDEIATKLHETSPIPIGRHTSIIDFLKEANHAINEGNPDAYKVPEQKALWEEMLLLESDGNDDIQRYVSIDYSSGRVSFLTPWLEARRYTAFINTIQEKFHDGLKDMADVRTTGLIALLAKTSVAVLDSMAQSYAIALILITFLMCVTLSSIRFGLLSMIPNIVPFILLIGLMGSTGMPLDTFTVLIGSIITGIIVDDTTHFFYQYKNNVEALGDMEAALRHTVKGVAVPMFTTTAVVIGAFGIFTAASMHNIQSFGLLMVFGSTTAFLADWLLSPALLVATKIGLSRIHNKTETKEEQEEVLLTDPLPGMASATTDAISG